MKKFLVGGAVRDKLLGLEPNDLDWLIVGATPADVQAMLAEGYREVGEDFPVFLHPTTDEEYALARVERKTGTGYNGFSVRADETVTLEQDLSRRDFTVNAMALDEDGKLHDPFMGEHDLKLGLVRHTTEAFAEDPLRVLRAARFASRFNWRVHPETVELCHQLGPELQYLTIERVWTEFRKGLELRQGPGFFMWLRELKVDENCLLAYEVFGGDHQRILEVLYFAARVVEDTDDMIFTSLMLATFVTDTLEPSGASSRLKKSLRAVRMAMRAVRDEWSLLSLVITCGLKQEGESETFKDVRHALSVLDLCTYETNGTFTSAELEQAGIIVRSVRAADFPDLQGKELGLAIEGKRLELLSSLCVSTGE